MRCTDDAERIIAAGGVYVNGSRMVNGQQLISADKHVLPNNLTLLRIGAFELVVNYVCEGWLDEREEGWRWEWTEDFRNLLKPTYSLALTQALMPRYCHVLHPLLPPRKRNVYNLR